MDFSFSLNALVRIILSCLFGYFIGVERQNKNKSAGKRTHTIVCLGSCLAMIISKYGFDDVPRYDAARVAAQVVSGIGFLGAGLIFVKNYDVTGLTTAAGIWSCSIVGMAFGSGLYFLGSVSSIIIILLQNFMSLGDVFQKHRQHTLIIEFKGSDTINKIDDYLNDFNIRKKNLSLEFKDGKFMFCLQIFPETDRELEQIIDFLEHGLEVEKFDIY